MQRQQNFIYGSDILNRVKELYAPLFRSLSGIHVAIILVAPTINSDQSKYIAAEISAREKLKAFRSAGLLVDLIVLPCDITIDSFRSILEELNEDMRTVAVIIQMPVPERLRPVLLTLSKDKDVDGVTGAHPLYVHCAASESALRILQPFLNKGVRVAIVGGRGFVGSAIVRSLQHQNIHCIIIDIGDDLNQVQDTEVIVSATGHAELLDERLLGAQHKLVVDIGFIPMKKKELYIFGDVSRRAYPLVSRITPVPGGIGPLHIATLLERLAETLHPLSVLKWIYKDEIIKLGSRF